MKFKSSVLVMTIALMASSYSSLHAGDGTRVCSRCASVWEYYYVLVGVKTASLYGPSSEFICEVAELHFNGSPEDQLLYERTKSNKCNEVYAGLGCNNDDTDPDDEGGLPSHGPVSPSQPIKHVKID